MSSQDKRVANSGRRMQKATHANKETVMPAMRFNEVHQKYKTRYVKVNRWWLKGQAGAIRLALRPPAPVRQLSDMSQDEIAALEARYGAKIKEP